MSAPSVVDFYSPTHTGLAFGVKNPAHPKGHSGQDYNGWAAGTIIPSPFAGTVIAHVRDGATGNKNDLGNYVVVEVPGVGWFSFCHLVSFIGATAVGHPIRVGGPLGPLGNTGYSKGNHVHVMYSSTSKVPNTRRGLADPKPYIDAVRRAIAGGELIPFPTPDPQQEEDMPIVLRSDARGEWLVAASFAHHMTPEEATQVATLNYQRKDCGNNDRAFDVLFNAHTINAVAATGATEFTFTGTAKPA